jgi:broad specificity phosphatase PhoE
MAVATPDGRPGERVLLLVRHAAPRIVDGIAARDWMLSDAGRKSCAPLADYLAQWSPASIISSDEPKATETGALIARRLRLQCECAPDLHEHERTGVSLLGRASFERTVRRFFDDPDELVFGSETAAESLCRFSSAVAHVELTHPVGNVAIITHGTVLSLFVAESTGADGFATWQQLGMPGVIALSMPPRRILARQSDFTSVL